jgi:hypothetical protein
MNKIVGYWYSHYHKDLPHVEDHIDFQWDDEERARVVSALKEIESKNLGRNRRYKGFSRCRVCEKINGSTEREIGGYRIPYGYVHYIEEHGVKPEQEFINWILGVKDGE